MQGDDQGMDAPNPQELLRSDHACLDALFEELLDEFANGHQREMRSTWTEFDRSVPGQGEACTPLGHSDHG